MEVLKSRPLHPAVLLELIESGRMTAEERRGRLVDLQPPRLLRVYHAEYKKQEEDLSLRFSEQVSIDAFDPHTTHFSTRPFRQLSRISLKQLRLEIQNVDKYVIVRVLEPAIKTIGWSSVVEDEHGTGCYLDVYNYPKRELFCVGTILAIKEPYFKIAASGQPIIRCDCPTDIIVLRRSHELYREMVGAIKWKNELGKVEPHEEFLAYDCKRYTAIKWKQLGKQLFKQRHLSLAKECYLMALMKRWTKIDSLWISLKMNLCAVYLGLGYYEKTIETCLRIRYNAQALFRVGQAFYELREYQEAVKLFEKVISKDPENSDAPILLSKARFLLNELERFDQAGSIKRLLLEGRKDRYKLLNHGELVGPVNIVKPPTGRKMVVTENVKERTVLFVSKALTCNLRKVRGPRVTRGDGEFQMWQVQEYDLELIAEMVQAIARNPETFGHAIYNLLTGDLPDVEVNLYCDPETKREVVCDVELISEIWYRHHFPITSLVGGQLKETGAGFFVLPAYINHSCKPNVYYAFYNNIMVVYSLYDLKADEEVLINYVPCSRGRSYEEQKQNLVWRGITCECDRCKSKV